MQCLVRLKKELERFHGQPPPGISYWQTDDAYQLKATVLGPDETPYENGVFYVDIHVPERYPFVPPNVRFVTPVYHPNIDDSGRICLDILKMPPQGSWKPSLNIASILMAIQLLMGEPNFNESLMADIANEYQMNRSSFMKHAKENTLKYAAQHCFSSAVWQHCIGQDVPCTLLICPYTFMSVGRSLFSPHEGDSLLASETIVEMKSMVSSSMSSDHSTPDAKRRKIE